MGLEKTVLILKVLFGFRVDSLVSQFCLIRIELELELEQNRIE